MRIGVTLCFLIVLSACLHADDWPQWMGPKRDNVWREDGILDKFPKDGPKVLWRVPIGGGYSSPSIANGKVYVTDFLTKGDNTKEVYSRTNFDGKERILCLDAKTGKEIWKYEYNRKYTISFPNGPRSAPTVDEDRVYTLGAEGDFVCLDANKGTLIWKKDFQQDYNAKTALWGHASHPLIFGNLVISLVGGENACVVAWDKKTGKEAWKSLNAREPGYGTVAVLEDQGQAALMVWNSEGVYALDPESGKKFWEIPLKPTNGASIMSPMKVGKYFFVSGYDGVGQGMLWKGLREAPELLWKGKKGGLGVFPVNCQPFAEGDYVFGVDYDGDLRCIELATGKRLWETFDYVQGKKAPCGSVFLVKHQDRFFMFNEKGELIIAKLNNKDHEELDRKKIIEPTGTSFGRSVVFCSPAFAQRCVFVRNDKEIICVSLAKE